MIVLLIVLSFSFMEFVAWSNHKYVMHGFLWSLHKDHHLKFGDNDSVFQKNDFFFLIYALPAIILITTGIALNHPYLVAIGAGITLYGITYFLIHDVVIHKRLPFFRNPGNSYIQAVIRAHNAHHKPASPKDFKCFGLLLFPGRYLKN